MEHVEEHCKNIKYLNLSYNSIPSQAEDRSRFLEHLVTAINTFPKLILLNIAGMNFREHVKVIQWPMARSKTLQSIHLSDNNIPKAVETNMLMVFGIKDQDSGEDTGITGKLDTKFSARAKVMTGFQIKLQQRLEEDKKLSRRGTVDGAQIISNDDILDKKNE